MAVDTNELRGKIPTATSGSPTQPFMRPQLKELLLDGNIASLLAAAPAFGALFTGEWSNLAIPSGAEKANCARIAAIRKSTTVSSAPCVSKWNAMPHQAGTGDGDWKGTV